MAPSHRQAFQPAANTPACAFPTGRCGARDGISSGSSPTGHSTTPPFSAPAAVSPTSTRVVAGDEFACALLADGTARCWGLGESGQRGDGTFTTFSSRKRSGRGERPQRRRRPRRRIRARLCAPCRRHDAVLGRQRRRRARRSDPAQPGSAAPVAVSGITGAIAITTGAFHTCAVLADRTVRCWGRNDNGQLGDGTMTNASTPVPVSGITSVAAVSGGGAHTCALLARRHGAVLGRQRVRTARRRDEHDVDHAGAGSLESPAPSASAPGGDTPARSLETAPCSAGGRTSSDSSATAPPRTRPPRCRSAASPAPSASLAGGGTTAARCLADGTVRCWGMNEWGQLGNGTTSASSTPVDDDRDRSHVGEQQPGGRHHRWNRTGNGRRSGNHDDHGHRYVRGKREHDAHRARPCALSVVRAGTGAGSVISSPAGISCGAECSALYDSRHQRDTHAERGQPVHLRRLDRVRHGLRRDVYGDHQCGDDSHRDIRAEALRRSRSAGRASRDSAA